MVEFTYSGRIDASPDVVYAYLADVTHLPAYLPLMSDVRIREDGTIDTVTTVKGQDHVITAWFEPDAAARTIAWGSARTEEYSGHLAVRADGDATVIDFAVTSPRDHTLEPYLRAATDFLANILTR